MKKVLVWDLPTRLFHWLLVAAVAAAYITGETGGDWLLWHTRLGFLIAGLIAFRLLWGFIGSTYARFPVFVHGPASIKAYLAGRWQGLGHNPLGALAVLALLAAVTLQITSGLFAISDDSGIAGPFHALVSDALGTLATRWHHWIFDILAILVALHIAAIVFYARIRKNNLLLPMLTGHKEVSAGESARGGGLLVTVIGLIVALAVTYAASGLWLESPAPPPPATVPTR